MGLFDFGLDELIDAAIGAFGSSGDLAGTVADIGANIGDLPGEDMFFDTLTGSFVTADEMAQLTGGLGDVGSSVAAGFDPNGVEGSINTLPGDIPGVSNDPIGSSSSSLPPWLKALAQGGAGLAGSLMGGAGGAGGLQGLRPMDVRDPGQVGVGSGALGGLGASGGSGITGSGGVGAGTASVGGTSAAALDALARSLGISTFGAGDTPGRERVTPLDPGPIPVFSPMQIPLAQGAPAQMAAAAPAPRLSGLQRLLQQRR